MNNFIFLTNQYLPKPGATGLCIHQIAKNLVCNGGNVWTVCYEDGDGENEYDGVKAVKINPPIFLRDNQSSSGLKRKIQYLESLCSKLVHLRKYPLRSNGLINSYREATEKIIKEVGKVTIVASYTPLEALVAATLIKRKYPETVKIAYYSADTLSNEQGDDGLLSAEYRMKAGIRWEKYLFERFDKIFIMECHKDYYFSDDFRGFQSKFEIVNFPLLVKNSANSDTKIRKNKKVRLVYAGTLYQKLRNPDILNDVLLQLSKHYDIEAFFLGGGDCEEIMKKAEIESNGSIKYLGMQSHKTAIDYISSADVLLSIGNVESPMAPSKIYEYMSTGKPIIHTYTYDKDPCIEPLKKYRNAKLIKADEEYSIVEVLDFIRNMHTLKYEDVEQNFVTSTPAYTANIIRSI